jgi:hypothetical protein
MIVRQQKDKHALNEIPPVSIRNEEQVLGLIAELSLEMLTQFDTSLSEDKNILAKSKDLTNNLKNCIIMRMGEKEVLNSYIKLNKTCSSLFELYRNKKTTTKKIQNTLNQARFSIKHMESYFDSVIYPLLMNNQ